MMSSRARLRRHSWISCRALPALLIAIGALWAPTAAAQDALIAIDSCVRQLDPGVDIGYERIATRCPDLARRLDKADWSAWLPRSWKQPDNDLSAGGLQQLRVLVARELAMHPIVRTPRVERLTAILADLGQGRHEPPGWWTRCKAWLRDVFGRPGQVDADSGFNRLIAHVGFSEAVIETISYAALALALVALFYNQVDTRTEREIALDKQREELLQAYLDRMAELLLDKGLRTSPPDAEVRNVARVRTISILTQLDVRRVEYVFAFLHEAGLLEAPEPIVSFKHARLTPVNWSQVRLRQINLSGADLSGADLSGADLSGADLSGADLSSVNLLYADLHGVTLIGANLSGAQLSGADLSKANLHGTDLHGTSFRKNNLLRGISLREADLSGADLSHVNLRGADLHGANLNGADLRGTDFRGTDLRGATLFEANLQAAGHPVVFANHYNPSASSVVTRWVDTNLLKATLQGTDLRGVKGLRKEQLEACKAKGALVDEDLTTNTSRPVVASPLSSQSKDVEIMSAPSTQRSPLSPGAGGSSAASPQREEKS